MLGFSKWQRTKTKLKTPSQPEFPESPEVMIGLVDLDLEDVQMFLPPHIWDEIESSLVKVEGGHLPGSGRA